MNTFLTSLLLSIATIFLLTALSQLQANDTFAEDSEQILEGLIGEPLPDETQLFRAKGSASSVASVNLRIKFDHGSARLKSESIGLLNELGEALQNSRIRKRRVSLNGHTDSSGAAAYNLALSEQRAKAVKDYLVNKLGLASERFALSGLGESAPLNNNATQIQREVNRRVEISLLP